MPTTFAFEFAANSFSSGISDMHGAHHEAQKFKTTTWPLSELLSTVLPSSDLREKSGIVLPTTTSSGLTPSEPPQPGSPVPKRQMTMTVNSFLISLLLILPPSPAARP